MVEDVIDQIANTNFLNYLSGSYEVKGSSVEWKTYLWWWVVLFGLSLRYDYDLILISQSKVHQNYSSTTAIISHYCCCTLNPRPFPKSRTDRALSEAVPSRPKFISQFVGQSLLSLQSVRNESICKSVYFSSRFLFLTFFTPVHFQKIEILPPKKRVKCNI